VKFLELVQQRRSVRRYAPEPISRKDLDQCIEAARLAPSANNEQPWYFIVVDDRQAIQQLVAAAMSGIYATSRFVKHAAALVVVITEPGKLSNQVGSRFRRTHFNLIDIAIACEHLVLQAQELGIGSCWLGWFKEKAVKRFLKLPRSARIDIVISLGYPRADDQAKVRQRKTLDSIRRYYSSQ
jgi:nitroreductase